MQTTGNTFLVTGGASGLGAACVKALVAKSAHVIVADVQEEAGVALCDKLGQKTVFAKTDVTSEADVNNALHLVKRFSGALRGVINCAGILGAGRIAGREAPHDLAMFENVVRVNLIGAFNVMRLAVHTMLKFELDQNNERGVIINTASVAAFEGQIGQAAYSASKGGVASMTLPAARELGQHGIRVNAVAPGIFDTPMMQAAPPAVRESLEKQIPFPARFGQPEEFAALAMHIIENSMLNGATIRLDGAVRMGPK